MRRSLPTTTLTALALMFAFASPHAAGDDVATFLERNGLRQLLAVHLEHELEAAREEQRDRLVMRLASLYSQLLEEIEEPSMRANLEQRSRRLLAAAPDSAVDDLRLALLRGSYRNAERAAENHRLRMASEEELARASETLSEVIPKLLQLGQRLEQRIEVKDRRLGRASGSEAVLLADEIDELRQLGARADFLRAWALYYQSWIHERRENAKVAERVFASLLDPERTYLEPDEVSEDLRGAESMARCILGTALCKSLTASTATAIAWIDLLEHEDTYEPLREQAPAWKMAIYLENGAFRQAQDLLEAYRRGGEKVPTAWLRLAAVHALDAADGGREARDLVNLAVTDLAGRGELDQILDLAERYGPEALGNSGFALRYVRGLMAYHEAREAHGDDTAIVAPPVAAKYDEAIESLRGALAETDAPSYPEAAAASHRLIAWCLYFQGRFLDARQAFEIAADRLEGDDAADALWMAIVSLDKVDQADGGPGLRRELNALIERFLDAYPASPHTPKLIVKQAVGEDPPTPETIRQLLAIPAGSEVHDQARRQAADMLYRLFRAALGPERRERGDAYLEVAAPLIAEDAERVGTLPPRRLQRFLVRCRRSLEVALDEALGRPAAARTVLDTIDALEAQGLIDIEGFRDEVEYRRMRLSLAVGDFLAASNAAEALRQRTPDSSWTRVAMRAMFRAGYEQWLAIREAGGDDRLVLEAMVRYGQAVLDEYGDDESALQEPAAMSCAVAVAEGCLQIWERSRDDDRGRQALGLYERLLAVKPRNARFLRATAILAGAFDDEERALECWRRLVAGVPSTSEGWYEAKFHVIEMLSRRDPARARAVLEQHKHLNPDLGPEPWGAQLKALDATLPPPEAEPATEASP